MTVLAVWIAGWVAFVAIVYARTSWRYLEDHCNRQLALFFGWAWPLIAVLWAAYWVCEAVRNFKNTPSI